MGRNNLNNAEIKWNQRLRMFVPLRQEVIVVLRLILSKQGWKLTCVWNCQKLKLEITNQQLKWESGHKHETIIVCLFYNWFDLYTPRNSLGRAFWRKEGGPCTCTCTCLSCLRFFQSWQCDISSFKSDLEPGGKHGLESIKIDQDYEDEHGLSNYKRVFYWFFKHPKSIWSNCLAPSQSQCGTTSIESRRQRRRGPGAPTTAGVMFEGIGGWHGRSDQFSDHPWIWQTRLIYNNL